MRTAILTALVLALGITTADAKRKRYHIMRGAVFVLPAAPIAGAMTARAAAGERRRGGGRELIPAGWQLQAADPDWRGRRYLSPGGQAWLALYASPAENKPRAEHFKTVAFADGEQISYLQGAADWLAVSGLKGERIYYRKAVLACGGTTWRHVAFEYPAEARRDMDRFVTRMSRLLDASADEGCGGDMFGPPAKTEGSRGGE